MDMNMANRNVEITRDFKFLQKHDNAQKDPEELVQENELNEIKFESLKSWESKFGTISHQRTTKMLRTTQTLKPRKIDRKSEDADAENLGLCESVKKIIPENNTKSIRKCKMTKRFRTSKRKHD